ncbi:MAG: hypothetical protein IJX26_03830, partial [Clostridia bacterium]|nr:hypothetical protein [Clostridia bacterium]
IPANSYGYIDIVDYIQTITWGNIYNLVGCRLVVNSLSAEYLEDYSEWTASGTATKTSVSVENSTSTNPILFGYASHMGTSSTLDFNVAINNDIDQAVTVSSVVVTPKFVAYNGQTGANYGIARTKYISFGDYSSAGSKFIYDHNVWQLKSTNTDNVTGAISYTFATNGISIAPHSSISLISGVDIANSDAVSANWLIELGEGNSAKSFHADYWFEVETSSVSSAITDATYSSTTTAEFITELDNGTINSGASSYVAVRNNTLQTISNITFTANLANISNLTNDIAYNLTNYATSSTTQNNSQANNISITFTGINLLPGESLILCLIEVTSGSNVGFTSYSINATLSSKPTLTNVYLKRDMASGNVSVINGTSETQSLSVVLADFANYGGNSPTVINDVSLLNGGEDKWTYNSADNSLTFEGDFLAGQMINLLEDFYDYNVIKG